MKAEIKHSLTSAALLALFALAGTGAVALIYQGTHAQIQSNERQAVLHTLNELVPHTRYDNDFLADTLTLKDEALGTREAVKVYRARKDGQAVAAVLATVAPNGYNGRIDLLVGINADGSLSGVRVVKHHETPGLGDAIEEKRSPWVLGFDGKSLDNPSIADWKVKRDGGQFDQFTGATITPRAVVKAVKDSLIYFSAHKETLFKPVPDEVSALHE